MKQVAAALAVLGLVVVGRGVLFPAGSVQVATADGPCYVNEIRGLLVTDPTSGTAIIEDGATGYPHSKPINLVSPSWYTGRRVGSEVEVLDPQGNVVATTGHHVVFGGGGTAGGFLVCGLTPPPWFVPQIPQEVLLPLAVLGLIGTILVLRVVLPRRSFAWPDG
jgi:hypothetical protein